MEIKKLWEKFYGSKYFVPTTFFIMMTTTVYWIYCLYKLFKNFTLD